MNKCRVCGGEVETLYSIENLPAKSQFFPDEYSLKEDKSISLNIAQCASCGLIQLINEPVSYYKTVIRATSVSSEMKKFRLKQLKQFFEKYDLYNKKCIEIGSGNGDYLSILAEISKNVYGFEYSSENIKYIKEKGLKAIQGYIDTEKYELPDKPYDAFFMFNFLEHVPEPVTFLRGLSNNLNDNGIGIIEVPNFNMIKKEKMISEFTIDHLSYFTKKTLEITLRISGFEIIEINEIWNDYIISAIVKKRNKLNFSGFQAFQETLKKNIYDFINKYPDFAIWGAGHQALFVMAALKLGDKCRYVIDSAKFKQNKYTPATHIKIVSPNYLRENPVKAIIIMAGSYSNEIKQKLLEEYPEIKIAILEKNKLKII
ncbi:class I SAM-dependent methyltransferase [Marinitoga sp. 1155]|uniref:class I SAM-dependent methyltransferase n=1 Tax=Marinitoga sp. 1155 TaxID=1428448 RepID=UPI0006418852|nr:class I SAM-dependent methyltransferase [Marinitoga sp. 1155]KLO21685.1 methyltransferase [Marinitoga sp. 1155]